MLTKGDLFNVLKKSFNEGKDILGNRKEFQSAVHSHLRSNFGIHQVSEFDLTKFSKNYTDSICKHLNESRNRPYFMLESNKHIKFFSTIIPYGVQHSQKRKFEEEEAANSDAIQPKSKRQNQRDATAVNPDALQFVPQNSPQPSIGTQTFGLSKSWLKKLSKKRKIEELKAENPELILPEPKSKRQNQRDAKDVRDNADGPDAIHLASAQEHGERGHWDAHYVTKMLAENPEKYGPFLRYACKRIDEDQTPKMGAERALSTLLHKQIPGLQLVTNFDLPKVTRDIRLDVENVAL